MVAAFVPDATRPMYGKWQAGWWVDGGVYGQFTMRNLFPGPAQQELPPVTLKPTGLGVEGLYEVTDGSPAEDVYAVNAPGDGSFRLYFDLASLVQDASYTVTFNATGVADNSDTIAVNWCGGASLIWDTANPNPFSHQFDAPPAYTAEFRYLEIAMPSGSLGDFFIHDVSITRVV